MTYLERFRQLAEEIQSHPLLEVVEFKVNSPASESSFNQVEQKLAAPLAEAIRTFYRETDGLKLHWKLKSSTTYEELEEISSQYDDYWIESVEDGYLPFAKINLLPLEETFFTANWGDIIFSVTDELFGFAGITYSTKNFAKMLRPFDEFSVSHCMAFLVEEGVGDPKVLLLQDHYATWESSRLTNFESYLEFLLITRGIFQARLDIYGEYSGHTQPPLIRGSSDYLKIPVPKLFRSDTSSLATGEKH
jgi:hypothetical protein